MKHLFKILPLLLILGLGINSCKKDDDTKHCESCTIEGTITYLPIGCVGNSTTLGIKDQRGRFYYVNRDLTNRFHQYKEGATVCFDYNPLEDCVMHLQTGIMKMPI